MSSVNNDGRPRGMDELILGFPVPDGVEIGIDRPPPGSPYTPRSPELSDPKFIAIGRGEGSLAVGARGSAAKGLQKALIALGKLPAGSADGVFGRGTERALVAFQRENGLGSDGKLGRKTLETFDLALLIKAGATSRPPAPAPAPGRPGPAPIPVPEPSRPAAPAAPPASLTNPTEREAFAFIADKLFMGVTRDRFDLGISDEETYAVMNRFDTLSPASYRNVLFALTEVPGRGELGSLADVLIQKGTSDIANYGMSVQFYQQAKSKLGALGQTPEGALYPKLSPMSVRKLTGHLRAAGIG